MKSLIKILLILVLSSCGTEQKSFDESLKLTHERKLTSASCSGTNFHRDILEHDNLINTFECLSWNDRYPNLYSFIVSLDSKNYNLAISPINQLVFNSTNNRNKFFELSGKFFNLSRGENVTKTLESILENKKISKLFRLALENNLFPNPDVLKNILDFSYTLEKKIGVERSKFSQKMIRNIKTKENLVSILKSILENLVRDKKSFEYFSKSFFENDSLVSKLRNTTQKEFYNITYFPALNRKITSSAIRLENIILTNRYSCEDYQNIYNLVHENELVERMSQLRSLSQEEFLQKLIDLRLKFILYDNICPYPELNSVVTETLKGLIEFTSSNLGFELVQKVSKALGDDPYVLFKYVKSDFYKYYQRLAVDDLSSTTLMDFYPILKSIDEKDFENLKQIMNSILSDDDFLTKLGEFWENHSEVQKKELIEGFLDLSLLPIDQSHNIDFIQNFLDLYPEIYSSLVLDRKYYRESLYLVTALESALDNRELKDEITEFFSRKNLFKLFDLINQGQEELEKPNEEEDKDPLVLTSSPVSVEGRNKETLEAVECLSGLHTILVKKHSFWDVLEAYPKACLGLKKDTKYISHKIFEWTFSIDKVFAEMTGGRKFSVPYGVISREMMLYYNGIIQLVNKHLEKENPEDVSGYVGETIDIIKRHLYDFGLMEVLEQSVLVLDDLITTQKESIDNALLRSISLNPSEFEQYALSFLKIANFSTAKSIPFDYTSDYITPEVGELKSFSPVQAVEFYNKAKNLLLAKNNRTGSLLFYFLKLVHPDEKIRIPYNSKKQRDYEFTIEKFVEFLFDISDPRTKTTVKYRDKNSVFSEELSLVSRLEIVIREISFLDNFYGSYFVNKASAAKNYTKDLKKLKKNVKLLEKTGGVFRRLNFFPLKTKWAFKNITQTYDSLWELNSGDMRHGDLIQSILTMSVLSSSKRSQKFSPYRKPKPSIVKRHNAKFITLLTEVSALRHLSGFLRNNYSKEEILLNKKFQGVNRGFLKAFSFNKTYQLAEMLLKHQSTELILKDLLVSITDNESEYTNSLVQIAYEFLLLISDTLQNQELDPVLGHIETLLDNYDIIKKSFISKLTTQEIKLILKSLKKINMLNLEDKKKLVKSFVSIVVDEKFSLVKILDEKSLSNFSLLLTFVENYQFESSSNFLGKLLKDKNFSLKEVQELMKKVYSEQNSFDYLYGLIRTLGYNDKKSSGLRKSSDALFIQNDAALRNFLLEIFTRFELKD